MKKILFVVCLLLMVFLPFSTAQAVDTWYKTLSGAVAWDAVTTYEDGSPFDAGEVMTYNVYMKNVTSGAETKIASTPNLSLAIVIPNRGKYRLGIQAELSPTEQSSIGWSDDPVVCSATGTFGFRLMFPSAAKNLRKQ